MVTNFQIFERKQVGVIYHFTSLYGIKNILEQNQLFAVRKWISFTRTKHPNNIYGREHRCYRISLDGDKLSDNYKFEPYNDFADSDEKGIGGVPRFDETEERIVLSPKHRILHEDEDESYTVHSIKNIKKYIIKVDVKIDSKDTYLELKEKHPDIEINIIEKW